MNDFLKNKKKVKVMEKAKGKKTKKVVKVKEKRAKGRRRRNKITAFIFCKRFLHPFSFFYMIRKDEQLINQCFVSE